MSTLADFEYAPWVLQGGYHRHLDELTAVVMTTPKLPEPEPIMERQDNVAFSTQNGLPSRDELIELLQTKHLIIHAFKEDGENMQLHCTLIPGVLPPPKNPGPSLAEVVMMPSPSVARANVNTQRDPNHITVWCTDRKAWRSFRYERLSRVEEASTQNIV